MPYYLVGQVVGGILAGGVLYAIALSQAGATRATIVGRRLRLQRLRRPIRPRSYKLVAAILVEVVLTGRVRVRDRQHLPRQASRRASAAIAVGLTLTLIHLISIPVDNTSVNPARSLGVAVFEGGWALTQLWVFIVFPLIGGTLGALVWRLLGDETARPPRPRPDRPSFRARSSAAGRSQLCPTGSAPVTRRSTRSEPTARSSVNGPLLEGPAVDLVGRATAVGRVGEHVVDGQQPTGLDLRRPGLVVAMGRARGRGRRR